MCSDYSAHCLKQNVEAHGPPLLVPQDETPANFGLGSLPDKSWSTLLCSRGGARAKTWRSWLGAANCHGRISHDGKKGSRPRRTASQVAMSA